MVVILVRLMDEFQVFGAVAPDTMEKKRSTKVTTLGVVLDD